MKERKTMLIDGFLGVDFTTSPLKVNHRRAVSGVNFISEYGTLKKRHGWIELIKFIGKSIKGIYNYKRDLDDFLIVRAGDKFYKVDKDFSNYSTLYTLSEVSNENVQFFATEDKVVITGVGKILLFYHNGTTYVIDELINHAYIPTTSISIDHTLIDDPIRLAHERPNILSNKRKNTLHGTSTNPAKWILDGELYWNESTNQPGELTIDVETLVGESLVTSHYYAQKVNLGGGSFQVHIFNEMDVKVGFMSFKWDVISYRQKETSITLEFDTTSPIDGMDNITVTFETFPHESINSLENSKQGVIYGVNGTNSQLFLADGATEYFSKAFDFTYFPDDQITTIGNIKNPIVGYSRISDTSLVIFKGNKINESRIYFRIMELITDDYTLTAKYRLYDRAVELNVGCDAPLSIENLAGDHLFLSKNGVYAITLGDNVSVEQRHVRERSEYINKHLMTKNITQSRAIVHDNRYYLAVDDSVYLADARFRTQADMDDTFNYEWFYWENMPVKTWFEMDNELYFGTEAGRICKFDDNYSDRTIINAAEGEVTINVFDNHLVYYQEIPVEDNDEIIASCFELKIHHSTMTVDGQLVTVGYDLELILEEGMEIYADSQYSELVANVKYYVSDLTEYTFKLKNASGVYVNILEPFSLLIDLSNETLYTTNVDDENNKFQLKRNEDGLPIQVFNYTTNPITFKIIIHDPVRMVWYSSIMDLGTNMFTKTLFALTISADAATTGKIDFGFDTRNISSNIQSLNFQVFDFNDIDFHNFTFLTAIASSYTKQVKEKDFNFIILKIGSETPSSAIINSLQILYKVNQMNRGIR